MSTVHRLRELSSDAAVPSGAYTGYAMFMNFGLTTGRSAPFQLLERTASSGDLLQSSGNWGLAVNAPGFGNNAIGYTNGSPYTFVWTLTRTAGGLNIVASMSGGNINGSGSVSVSTNDLTPSSFTYDTFALRPSDSNSTASSFDASLFKVEFITVPEPSTFALLGVALVGFVAAGRRLRRKA